MQTQYFTYGKPDLVVVTNIAEEQHPDKYFWYKLATRSQASSVLVLSTVRDPVASVTLFPTPGDVIRHAYCNAKDNLVILASDLWYEQVGYFYDQESEDDFAEIMKVFTPIKQATG